MRSIWNGAIAFGLVNIPVSLFAAETKNDLKFNYRDARDESRIRYRRVNEVTGEEVPWDQIVRSYEFPDGDYVIMTDDDFTKADPAAVKTADIETFIQKDELSLMYLEKPYYLEPARGAEKPYVLLRNALAESNRIAVARVVLRSRQQLAVIYPKEDVLVLNLIRYYDDMRATDDLQIPHEAKITTREMDLALRLIDDMTAEWQPQNYQNEYRNALLKRIETKSRSKGKELPDDAVVAETAPGKVVDIVELLRQSVAAQPKKGKEKTGAPQKAAK